MGKGGAEAGIAKRYSFSVDVHRISAFALRLKGFIVLVLSMVFREP